MDGAVAAALHRNVTRAEANRSHRRRRGGFGTTLFDRCRHGASLGVRSCCAKSCCARVSWHGRPVHDFGRALLEKGLEPRLRLLVGLGDRRDQRLGEIAGGGIGLGDPRQHLGDREIGRGRIAGDALGELDALGETLAGRDEIVRDPDRLAFLGVIAAPGEHHVHHARGADEPRQAHRAAAADEDAAAAFGERVVGGVFRHPDVAGRRDFQPAADHGAVQHRDHRDLAELDVLERAMPAARMRDALRDVARAQLAEIETRAEMVAFARQHDGFDRVRHARRRTPRCRTPWGRRWRCAFPDAPEAEPRRRRGVRP